MTNIYLECSKIILRMNMNSGFFELQKFRLISMMLISMCEEVSKIKDILYNWHSLEASNTFMRRIK